MNYQMHSWSMLQLMFYTYKLKKILDGILLREGRDELAKDMFDFLPSYLF